GVPDQAAGPAEQQVLHLAHGGEIEQHLLRERLEAVVGGHVLGQGAHRAGPVGIEAVAASQPRLVLGTHQSSFPARHRAAARCRSSAVVRRAPAWWVRLAAASLRSRTASPSMVSAFSAIPATSTYRNAAARSSATSSSPPKTPCSTASATSRTSCGPGGLATPATTSATSVRPAPRR